MNELGTVFPSYHVTHEGTTVKISCYSQTEPKWTKKGFPQHVLTLFGQIVLINVQQKDSGEYTCHGYINNRGTSFNATSTLLVAGIVFSFFVCSLYYFITKS